MSSAEESSQTAPRPQGPGAVEGMLTIDEVAAMVATGDLDTVVVAFCDMQGRLVGKRIQGEYFVDSVVRGGVEACVYLLADDMEMEPVRGYQIANPSSGYGDLSLKCDMDTLRRIPWLEGTALVLCDIALQDGTPVHEAPRQVLLDQYQRAYDLGYTLFTASELEFYVYRETYRQAREAGYSGLEPLSSYNSDYHVLASTYAEPLIRTIRTNMQAAGIPIEYSKTEAWHGQQEINVRFSNAITSADRHVIYKNGVKEIAHQQGLAATFMPKPFDDSMGSSCHIHLSLVAADGSGSIFVDGDGEETPAFKHFIGGVRAHLAEVALLLAPTINSYKRYSAEGWAPNTIAWGRDNRTCGIRVVGDGQARRIECRIPGADANPYLAKAILLAAGLDGIDNQIDPGPELHGSAYESANAEPFPSSLREAIVNWERSEFAQRTLGEQVWSHYLNFGKGEQRSFDAAVTDWERHRYFERG